MGNTGSETKGLGMESRMESGMEGLKIAGMETDADSIVSADKNIPHTILDVAGYSAHERHPTFLDIWAAAAEKASNQSAATGADTSGIQPSGS